MGMSMLVVIMLIFHQDYDFAADGDAYPEFSLASSSLLLVLA